MNNAATSKAALIEKLLGKTLNASKRCLICEPAANGSTKESKKRCLICEPASK